MFTPLCGRHHGVPTEVHKHAWQLHNGLCKFVENISTNIWRFRKTQTLKTVRNVFIISLLKHHSWLNPLNGLRIILLLRDSANQEFSFWRHQFLELFLKYKILIHQNFYVIHQRREFLFVGHAGLAKSLITEKKYARFKNQRGFDLKS